MNVKNEKEYSNCLIIIETNEKEYSNCLIIIETNEKYKETKIVEDILNILNVYILKINGMKK
jgi:hypothetical protein